MINQYKIDLPVFAGPLDLLLHLIERNELDITAVSLVQVTSQYLAQIEQLKEKRLEQLIDFLVIAARLTQIKSRALLPKPTVVIEGQEEEEDPAEALVRQLKLYKQFKVGASWLQNREEQGLRTYLRVAPPPKLESRLDLSGVTVERLLTAVRAALARLEEQTEPLRLVQPRQVTIEGQIGRLRQKAQQGQPFEFDELLSVSATAVELSVTLLAVLELIKRREIVAYQAEMFGPIQLQASRGDRAKQETPPLEGGDG